MTRLLPSCRGKSLISEEFVEILNETQDHDDAGAGNADEEYYLEKTHSEDCKGHVVNECNPTGLVDEKAAWKREARSEAPFGLIYTASQGIRLPSHDDLLFGEQNELVSLLRRYELHFEAMLDSG